MERRESEGKPNSEILMTSFTDIVAKYHPDQIKSDSPTITRSTLELYVGFDLTNLEIKCQNKNYNKHGEPLIEFKDFEVFVEQCLAGSEKYEYVFEDNAPLDNLDSTYICQIIQAKRNEQTAIDQIQ